MPSNAGKTLCRVPILPAKRMACSKPQEDCQSLQLVIGQLRQAVDGGWRQAVGAEAAVSESRAAKHQLIKEPTVRSLPTPRCGRFLFVVIKTDQVRGLPVIAEAQSGHWPAG
jgi:hypothetical protein